MIPILLGLEGLHKSPAHQDPRRPTLMETRSYRPGQASAGLGERPATDYDSPFRRSMSARVEPFEWRVLYNTGNSGHDTDEDRGSFLSGRPSQKKRNGDASSSGPDLVSCVRSHTTHFCLGPI